MTPAAIDRVFGRGRLRMVTGDHVEVFREESQPGERRRYTKRFLATPAGDFRHWTEREWRILARLVGHGIGPVPDVVQFDRGASGRQALVQTYDAGVTIDHWTTLLPVQRDGETRSHVFEDCAHWWALAKHSLVALDAIHDLHLVHLDLKADNVCIPVGPVDFDPADAEARLFPDFERIALIDFAFSLVSGERLESALPIARQTEFDYQSPRLLAALDEGSRGNLWPTRLLDWRCDLFSLAAMLRRYLPEPEQADAGGWTAARRAQACALVRRLLEAHDAELPSVRPHAGLIALADDELRDPELAASLERGWRLGEKSLAASEDESPTPITRIAMPVVLPATPVRFVDSDQPISIDPSDVAGWAAANPRPPTRRPRVVAWVAGLAGVAAAAAAVPLLGEGWRTWVAPAATAPVIATLPAANTTPPALREAMPARSVVAKLEPKREAPATAAPEPVASPSSATPPEPSVAAEPAPEAGEKGAEPVAKATEPAAKPAEPAAKTVEATAKVADSAAKRGTPAPARRAAPGKTVPAATTRVAAAPSKGVAVPARSGAPVAVRPAAFPLSAKASPRPGGRAPVYLPPAVGLAPLPGRSLDAPAGTIVAAAPSTTASPSTASPAEESAALAPPDFMLRANELLSTQVPRIAQRAERMVLRVLVAASHADEDGRDDDEIRLAAQGIRLAPDDPQLARTAVREARQFHESARTALRRGDLAEAVALQTRAFGANPTDAEVVGSLAWLRLRQSQPEAARRLALHALTLHDWKYPAGRIEDWNTFAIASALTGRERDARNGWLVALALGGSSERQCRAALDAYAMYGEALRSPVESMLQRASAPARATRSRLCEWPPHWSASVR